MNRYLAWTRAVVEPLEGRRLMTAVPLAISETSMFGQTELRISSLYGNDHITVKQTSAGLLIGNTGGWSTSVPPSFQQILIRGGRGTDSIIVDPSVQTDCTLYGGNGKNLLQAGSGNDTLVSLGSTTDTLIGGAGRDSFWTDNSPREKILNLRADEIAGGDVHRVTVITGVASPKVRASAASSRLAQQAAEPAVDPGLGYSNFSDHPLFSAAGPSPDDIFQGAVGDCYYLATLSAIAKVDPWRIRQSILDLGDGTFLVQFARGASKVYVHVDSELPTFSSGSLVYANFGAGSSMWVAIVEKAYVVFQGPPAYAAIDGGWMDQAFASLGVSSADLSNPPSPIALLSEIAQELSAHRAVTYATSSVSDNAPLLGGHAYSVDRVNVDAQGVPVSMTLRNPWGIDGAGNDGNDDGYVTVSAQQAYDCLLGVVSAAV